MDDFENIVEALVQPLGLVWSLSIIAAAVALAKRGWLTAAVFIVIVVVLFLFGSTSIPDRMLASLEKTYADRFERGSVGTAGGAGEIADAIVMLGGLANRSQHEALGMEVREAFDRALTAVELMRRLSERPASDIAGESQRTDSRQPKLILGGGGNRRIGWSESEALVRWMARWGMPTNKVLILPALANTYEEARNVRQLLIDERTVADATPTVSPVADSGSDSRHSDGGPSVAGRAPSVILVTSAYHMKRSEAVFRKAGLEVDPAPTDFIGLASLEAKRPFNPVPRAGGFEKTEVFLHEIIGWWVYRWRGWI